MDYRRLPDDCFAPGDGPESHEKPNLALQSADLCAWAEAAVRRPASLLTFSGAVPGSSTDTLLGGGGGALRAQARSHSDGGFLQLL